ncbi:hypothetical protein M6B38_203760 [Iris pallida]|uniref:Uncharacterized protein n=1 Tax=Iris pallida TaxID=29817 RepID=A0AAX6E7C4_IRIPA|nr:hypothetical protein M6B38_203760 [Iris pallida]
MMIFGSTNSFGNLVFGNVATTLLFRFFRVLRMIICCLFGSVGLFRQNNVLWTLGFLRILSEWFCVFNSRVFREFFRIKIEFGV